MSDIEVQIINKGKQELPQYQTQGSAGMDLRADLDAPISISPLERILVPTGLYIAIPRGYEGQVRARSGTSLKKRAYFDQCRWNDR